MVRLHNPDHPFASRPRGAKELVLMASEARKVDGELHTIVLRAHPMWKPFTENSRGLKILVAEFLDNFQKANDEE